ncbi:MAG: ester cyclase family protein [Acidobacteria bacterium]|nr:ester cyclase family protein [Acidobacteriota bacterium]MDA1233790.1 ester cyclase family protein [Acidobacteriota bacterium]
MSEKNKALVRDWIEAGWNQRRDSAIEDFCAEDFSGQDARQGLLWGHDGIGRLMAQMLIAFPDLKVRVDDLLAEDDLVVCRTTSTGTHRADFLGIHATGRSISMSTIVHFRIEGGLIRQAWRVWDAFGVLKSLTSSEELKGGLGFAPEIRDLPQSETDLNRAALNCLLDGVWNHGKIDISNSLLAEDFVLRDPNAPAAYSADQWRIRIAEVGQAFSNARFEIQSLIAEGDAVACRFRFDARHGGKWMGFPATGATISSDGALIARMSLGRCLALWQVRDEYGVYQQLQNAQPVVRAASAAT